VIDCKSPISQKILEMKLGKYLTEKNYEFIITDRKELQNQNIIQIGKDIHFPFSEKQIEKYLIKPHHKIQENVNLKEQEDCKEIEKSIFSIIKNHNNKLLKDIEAILEKR